MKLATCLAILLLPGCLFDFDTHEDEPRPAPPPPPPPPSRVSPSLSVTVPPWPPLGGDSSIRVSSQHPVGLQRLTFAFARSGALPISGQSNVVELTGVDLGEGYGRADLNVEAVDGGASSAFIEDLLVDLTPPSIDSAGPLLLRPDSVFRVRASDAWILGGAEIEIGGVRESRTFYPGFPASFGSAWDVADFELPVAHLSGGSHDARVVVFDAAGNRTSRSFRIEMDRAAPTLEILSPVDGSTVSEQLELVVAATDAEGDTRIDVSLGGTPVAELSGGEARAVVDLTGFPLGLLQIEARARDDAGNESTTASVSVHRH